ncbi:hypothetical protein CYK03_00030 [Pseudomonas aeruginosa]|nr:hypothetical protein [Pseudomonas aeruginosa]PLB07181.1 hypothetical protein CYK03_00030 [Pseudomonas aeruginosa]
MIEIRSLRDLLRLLFIYQREFKLAALSAVVIIVLGAFLLPAKYESNARLLVKPGRDSTLPIEISNRQALVMPSTQRDPIVDEERLLTGRPIVRQVAERYLEVLANRPPPEGLWKRTKFYVKKAIGAVFDGIRVTLETFGVIEETTAVERLAKDLEKKFEVTHAAGSTVMEISFTWSEPEVAQEVVKAWIEIYMEERTQALGRKSLYAFYEAQTADSAAQIKSYKAQILKHLNEIGASSIEDRLQDLSERINVLRGERFNSIRLIASSDSALESTRQQLKGLPREIVTVRQIALNPAQQDLRRLLNQKRLERADMMRTYTDDAPPVKALDACLAGVFLYRRHGQVALTLTPESIAFANAPQVPMYTFQSLEIERGRWLELTFATTFDCTAPSFDNHARFDPRAFARPEARAVAGGKRVKLALCGAALNGQKMELELLARLIYRYILAGHRQRALQHHRAPGSDGSGA